MSIKNPLDLSDWFNGKMDKHIENSLLLEETFSHTVLSALVVNPDLEIKEIGKSVGIRSIYIDLSDNNDYNLFVRHLIQFQYDGLLIDNVDKIPDNEDKDSWEKFVWFALKRENEYSVLSSKGCINFDEMHIAVRCSEYPEYLKGKSPQMVIIE